METDQIIDHGETTQIDSVHETSARTTSIEKHTAFYFVKYHLYEDPEITCKIEEAPRMFRKKTEDINYYKEKLKWYEDLENRAKWQLFYSTRSHEDSIMTIHLRREYLFHVQNALNKKCTDYRVAMQSPEVKELANHIGGLKHRVQKEKLTLKEEKQLIKQMNELNAEKDKVVALVSFNNNKRQKEVIKQCLGPVYKYKKLPMDKWPQSIMEDIDQLKMSQLDARKRMRYLGHYLEDIKSRITEMQQKINTAISERDEIDKMFLKSEELADKLNACYYENDGLLDRAKHLAVTKDIAALDELSNSELDKFFSQWNDNESVRNDYTRRVLWSLYSRGLSKDGRIANPDESPSTVPESSIPRSTPVGK